VEEKLLGARRKGMTETKQDAASGGHPFWTRRRIWLGGGALAGLAALAAAVPYVRASGLGGFGGHGRHRFGAQILEDPDAAKRHAAMAVEWALRGVSATDEQMQRAKGITDRLVDELAPIAAKHREHRQSIHQSLEGGEIDREALEQLRQKELVLADQASKLAVNAIADLGEVLTPQQRQELIAFAHRFHGGR
jgi:Spy/CpxP family protein refolding chaperone